MNARTSTLGLFLILQIVKYEIQCLLLEETTLSTLMHIHKKKTLKHYQTINRQDKPFKKVYTQ